MNPLIANHHSAIENLCRKYDVRRFDLIGSATRSDFDPGRNDIDFVVDFNNFNVDNAADRYLGLMVDLEDLFHRKIDLISYRAIRNPYFKQVVDSTRLNLYAA